jgi:hypothetical protein
MDETLVFAVVLLGAWLFLLRQRVPAMALFFSLLAGQILSTEISGEVYGRVADAAHISDFEQVRFGLLLAPVILTIIFMRHRAPSSRLLIEAIPMLFTVAAIAIFAYPYVGAIQEVLEEVTDHKVETYKNVIIGVATVSNLLSVWFSHASGGHKRSRKGKE